jgi:small subunit ribosomal protein S3e
MMIITFIL